MTQKDKECNVAVLFKFKPEETSKTRTCVGVSIKNRYKNIL